MTQEERIGRRYDRWIQAFNRGEMDTLLAMYSDQVVLNPPGGPELDGIEEVRDWMSRFFRDNRASQTQVTQEVQADDDWAWLRGKFEIEISQKRTGPFETIRGAHLMVWKRDDDGGWKIHRDIWNLT